MEESSAKEIEAAAALAEATNGETAPGDVDPQYNTANYWKANFSLSEEEELPDLG